MNKALIGHLVTEADAAGTPKPLEGFRVAVRVPGLLFEYKGRLLAAVLSKDLGRFQLNVVSVPATGTRHLEIVAYDSAGRELPFLPPAAGSAEYVVTEDGRARIEERPDEPQQDYGQFVIREADATGLLTTLGTGQTLRYSEGNRVTTLMDRDAFTYAAAMMRLARQEVLVSQPSFALPVVFDADPTIETPNMIFDFYLPGPVDLDTTVPRPIHADDRRPERVLLLSALRGVDIRILLHAFSVPLFIKIAVGVLLFPFAGTEGISVVRELFEADLTDTDEVKRYFQDAGAPQRERRGASSSRCSAPA